jgi:hypothetical protein
MRCLLVGVPALAGIPRTASQSDRKPDPNVGWSPGFSRLAHFHLKEALQHPNGSFYATISTIVAVAGELTITPFTGSAKLKMNVLLARPAVFNPATGTEMVLVV